MELDAVIQAVARSTNLTMESVARKDLSKFQAYAHQAVQPLVS
jgi:hypothetical protein